MTFGPIGSAWRGVTRGSRIRAAAVIVVAVLAAAILVFLITRPPTVTKRSFMLDGTPEKSTAGVITPVKIDVTLYLPDTSSPAPAVLLAHGNGGTKQELDAEATDLARRGFVALAYTARGFGNSGGLVHLDSPDYEVADAKLLVSYLATLPQVRTTAPNDPVVGVAGSSYGGGLALLLAGSDPRVDAVAADITFNNLQNVFFPNNAVAAASSELVPSTGVFKKLWAGYMFEVAHGRGGAAQRSPACGRVAQDICDAFAQIGRDGAPDSTSSQLLWRSSPASVDDHITAPTLLMQGEQDSLFPLSEADANARAISAVGTPVRMMWHPGGHDGGDSGDLTTPVAQWMDAHLRSNLPRSQQRFDSTFEMADQRSAISTETGRRVSQTLRATNYPGLGSAPATKTTVTLAGKSQRISAPGGGTPAAVSSLPGLSDLLQQAATLGGGSDSPLSALSTIDGQHAYFDSAPLSQQQRITGGSTVQLRVTSTTSDATLFVSLADLSPDGTTRIPASLVAPIRLTGLVPGKAATVQAGLPWVVTDIPAGHRIRLIVASTDLTYQLPADARVYQVALDGGSQQLAVPEIPTATIQGGASYAWLIAGLLAMAACVVLVQVLNRRGRGHAVAMDTNPAAPAPASAASGAQAAEHAMRMADPRPPVVIENLVKEYGDGYRAVNGASLRVERGQVVGLLGPNGAGKTTLLRTLVGLIRPTSGRVELFGAPVTPGADVLRNVGALIEGPGFLPHLSGRQNLGLFWAASGRHLSEAQLETALEIAGLGSSIDRKVKTYSHGMKQRLAIAQAMLGLPDLLVLDEPTNGLDPPQIAEMREVMRSYAATGRTVIVSSHLLSEVEQTCTHVVVMHKGETISAGPVSEVAGVDRVQLAVADPERAAAILTAAGMEVTQVPVRRALEGAFLDLVGER